MQLHAKICQIISQNLYKIIPWYGKLKAEDIPGIVEGGGIRKIFQKKYSKKKTFHHVRVIPGIISEGAPHAKNGPRNSEEDALQSNHSIVIYSHCTPEVVLVVLHGTSHQRNFPGMSHPQRLELPSIAWSEPVPGW